MTNCIQDEDTFFHFLLLFVASVRFVFLFLLMCFSFPFDVFSCPIGFVRYDGVFLCLVFMQPSQPGRCTVYIYIYIDMYIFGGFTTVWGPHGEQQS